MSPYSLTADTKGRQFSSFLAAGLCIGVARDGLTYSAVLFTLHVPSFAQVCVWIPLAGSSTHQKNINNTHKCANWNQTRSRVLLNFMNFMDPDTDFVGNDKATYIGSVYKCNNKQLKKCPPEDGLIKGQNM
jgi:hypothetical protein